MKTTIVPAQITTVEDKIAGSLSFTQLLLLVTPVFLGAAIFIVIPPLFKPTLGKTVFVAALAFICMVLAVRIKGKIIMQWLTVVVRYGRRPRFYLFNKNDQSLRAAKYVEMPTLDNPVEVVKTVKKFPVRSLIPTAEMARLENAILDPRAKFHLRVGKGGLRVHISEVKEEGL